MTIMASAVHIWLRIDAEASSVLIVSFRSDVQHRRVPLMLA